LRSAGKIVRIMYAKISTSITTDEVIITTERIEHSNLHGNAYEKYGKYIPDVLADPDFIFRDKKPNTAVLIKQIVQEKNNLQLAEDAEATLAALIDEKRREDGFGNARGVRNIFDAVQKQKNVRLHRMLMESGTFSAESAQSIMREDIEAIW